MHLHYNDPDSAAPKVVSSTQPLPVAAFASQDTAVVTIANAASLSGAADLDGSRLSGIIMPAAWTAADLTFQVSVNGTDYFDLYDAADTELLIDAAASRAISVDLATFAGWRYLKVRSGTSGTPVAQGASRVITLVVRPL